MVKATGAQEQTKLLGRPPRVSPAQIADAALAIGLERANIRNVAEYLGMSVPGLYHHVRTREDLLAMAAAHSLSELPLPEDHGQPWAQWLLEYGRFVYDALVAQPELVGQILAGTTNTTRMAQHLERFFAVLAGHGFSVEEAFTTYSQLGSVVTGAAATEIGRRSSIAAGHPRMSDLARAAKALGTDTVPLVVGLVRLRRPENSDSFDTVRIVVDGIAARHNRTRGR
jgi:AcrR family transcriptional regulator